MDNEEIIDSYIKKYQGMADAAYDRAWFKEQEQYLLVVGVLSELKEEIV